MLEADGNTRNTKRQLPSPSTSPPPSANNATPVQFTFINQHSDIRSVRDRRIQNPGHRHEIRSHVMRNVRLLEHNEGKKRPTGRIPGRTKSRDRKTSTAGSSTTSPDAVSGDELLIKRESPTVEEIMSGNANVVIRKSSHSASPMYISPFKNYWYDPFAQLPGNSLDPRATENLLKYCFSTFMPMTFPVESKQICQRNARKELVLSAKISNPATFSGFLATIACHRAIMFNNHKGLGPDVDCGSDNITDPDFQAAHHDATASTRLQLDKPGAIVDPDFLEACFGLISTTTIVGDFKTARQHLEGVEKALIRHNVPIPDTAEQWLPLADIKAALGSLDEPRFPLPWSRAPVDPASIGRMLPLQGDQLSRMARGFQEISDLSPPLRTCLEDASVICHMCDFNERDGHGLTEQEHETFRCKSLELEYDLLKYVFVYFPANKREGDWKTSLTALSPMENVIKLAILGILSTVSVYILPGCGLGRALTKHQLTATERWLANEASTGMSAQRVIPTSKAMTWALFVYAQCAKEQDEEQYFKELLAGMSRRLYVESWEDMESLVSSFLYVPNVMRPHWMKIWIDVEHWRQEQRMDQTPMAVERCGGQ